MNQPKKKRVLEKGKTEEYIKWYFEELQEKGYVHSINTNPSSIVIFEKIAVTQWVTLRQRVYTADFEIIWTILGMVKWCNLQYSTDAIRKPFISYNDSTLIEVKPNVSYRLARANTSMVTFPLRRNMLYQATGQYVQMVKTEDLFASTFTPKRYLLTDKTGKPRTIHFHTRTLDEYLQLTDNLTKPMPGSKWDRDEISDDDLGFKFVEDG